MNKDELVYDLKEHLDTYCQTYDDYIMSYGETDMIYHYIEQKDKELQQKENIIKEVREYIEKASYFQGNKVLNEKELLEILDKEVN